MENVSGSVMENASRQSAAWEIAYVRDLGRVKENEKENENACFGLASVIAGCC